MSQARRTASGIFVGPGMNTGFWKLMALSSLGMPCNLASRADEGNFFENIFQTGRRANKSSLVRDLDFFIW
jgi:hypothetical protein